MHCAHLRRRTLLQNVARLGASDSEMLQEPRDLLAIVLRAEQPACASAHCVQTPTPEHVAQGQPPTMNPARFSLSGMGRRFGDNTAQGLR